MHRGKKRHTLDTGRDYSIIINVRRNNFHECTTPAVIRLHPIWFAKEGTDLIEVRNLTKKYGDNLAVDNISFSISSGRVYGLLGPNGAGKTTTMNIITGCLAATSGTVTVADDPELITNPVQPLLDPANEAYSSVWADYYATKDNNEMFQETLSVGDHDCIFFLPPGGSLELPGVMVEPPLKTGLVEGEYREVYTYANARLTIPAGWSGTIELPLILYTVSGSGSIGVNGEAYAIGSAVLSEMFQERKTFFYPLTIAAESELQLTYLVNPQLFNLSTVNTVVLEGTSSASDACKLRVEMIPLSLNSKIDGGRS